MSKACIAKLESREVLAGIDWANPNPTTTLAYQSTDIKMTIRTGTFWWRLRMALGILFHPKVYLPVIEMEVKSEFTPPVSFGDEEE